MHLSVNSLMQAGQAYWQNRKTDSAAATPYSPNSPSASPLASAPSSDPTGIQTFASELQSFLVSLQDQSKDASTDPATNSDAAVDPGSNPVPTGALTHIAERLQSLLDGVTGSTKATDTSTTDAPQTLQSVLDKLQSTLTQALQSYGSTTTTAATTDILT